MCIINTCPPQRLSTRACVWVVCMLFKKIHDTSLRYIHTSTSTSNMIQAGLSGLSLSLSGHCTIYHLPYVSVCVHTSSQFSGHCTIYHLPYVSIHLHNSQFYYEVPIGAASCVPPATRSTSSSKLCLPPQFTVHGTASWYTIKKRVTNRSRRLRLRETLRWRARARRRRRPPPLRPRTARTTAPPRSRSTPGGGPSPS
jgi:hypothetical protein